MAIGGTLVGCALTEIVETAKIEEGTVIEQRLLTLVSAYRQCKILVVGDPMVDVYHFGRVDRMSQEAPVPVFVEDRKEVRPGGAANVAANLRALGVVESVVFPETSLITQKHRYVVGHQQLLRVDEDKICSPTEVDIARAVRDAERADLIVLSDYAKGWLTSELCQTLIQLGKPVVVDPKGYDWSKYDGAAVICPNEREWLAVNFHVPHGTSIVAKRGSQGLTVVSNEKAELFPAHAKHVFDVVGAGDTVTAVVAATLAAGGSLSDAAKLANYAAGYVVGIVGTAVCTARDLTELIHCS